MKKKTHLYSDISDYSVVFDTQNWLIIILNLPNLHHLSSQHWHLVDSWYCRYNQNFQCIWWSRWTVNPLIWNAKWSWLQLLHINWKFSGLNHRWWPGENRKKWKKYYDLVKWCTFVQFGLSRELCSQASIVESGRWWHGDKQQSSNLVESKIQPTKIQSVDLGLLITSRKRLPPHDGKHRYCAHELYTIIWLTHYLPVVRP